MDRLQDERPEIAEIDQSTAAPEGAPLYVVGVGASAGGLEALEQLFTNLPPDTGMAFVVVQHLSPDFDSMMGELLHRQTEMPIHKVEDGMPVEPNSIYLIPPKKEMIISSGKLLLTDKDPRQGLSLPIDTFFRSLAQEAGPRSISVVLSGTGSDGSRGIRDVHDAGGLVVVQSEDTAKFDGMPRSAQETGVVDLVLPPDQIAKTLTEYSKNPTLGSLTQAETRAPLSEDGTNRLLRLLREVYAIDFSLYKPTTIARRIERRLLLNREIDFDTYVERVASDPTELNALYRDLLIGVTQFFRDPEVFQLLERKVLPEMLSKIPRDEDVRAWVAGCATGEEAYSLAILIHEQLSAMDRSVRAKIFATDVHQASIDAASAGIYPESALSNVSAERRRRYFARKGKNYQVGQDLRQMVVFARHNVIKDAPFTRLDLISCRNLLIYLQPAVQKKVLSLFHFGLKSSGLLLLGPSEDVGELKDEFAVIDHHWKMYRKRRDVRLTTDFRAISAGPSPLRRQISHLGTTSAAPSAVGDLDHAYRLLLEQFVPAGILINRKLEVAHVFGSAAQYLHIQPGPRTNNVLELFDADLRTAVSGAVRRATRERSNIAYTGVNVTRNGENIQLKVSIVPLTSNQEEPEYLLIRLEEFQLPELPAEEASAIDMEEVSRDRIDYLESELRHSKENLQATIEELETSNEELQASNEELVASNEELQSTNEELHSVNEELYTVNAEHQRKITELSVLTEDMENLLASTDVGVLFLDKDLCIRRLTPRIAQSFNILEQDIGRPFNSFTHSIEHPGLLEDTRQVLQTSQPVEREVQDRQGRWHYLRILPYQTKRDVNGVVLTLIDIDPIKRAEGALHEKDQQLRGVLDNSPTFIFIKDREGRYLLVNRQCRKVLPAEPDQVIGKTDYDLLPRDVADRLAEHDRQVASTGETAQVEEVIPRKGKARTYLATKYPLRDSDAQIYAVAGILTDITRRKVAERRAQDAVRQRDRFLAMLSHELRNPLAAITSASELLGRMEIADQTLRNIADVIQRQSQQTKRLLDDLLDLSRVTQGKIELRREVVDLREVAETSVEATRSTFAQRRHWLEVILPEEPLYVDGDPVRLQQIHVNLLNNAAKYTPEGGRIDLEISRQDGQAVVRIRDNGLGMTKKFLRKVFEPFAQSKDSAERSDGGIGLGLTLVKSLSELHGGSVEAHSAGAGKGSQFTVRLPLTRKTAKPDTETPAAAFGPALPLRLLVVEDNPDIREMMKLMLEQEGYHVATAADGVAALTAVEVERPDVVFLDIGLPEMDGYEVARRLRKGNKELPLIALTGYGQSSDRRRAIEAGFDDHLAKPVNVDRLRQLLAGIRPRQDAAAATKPAGGDKAS